MALTRKEMTDLQDAIVPNLVAPDYVIITFAVCAVDRNGCGWGGWMLEGAMKISAEKTGILRNGDDSLPSVTLQICPNCRRELFRTGEQYVFDRSGPASLRFPDSR